MKNITDLPGIHDLKGLGSVGRKSSIPTSQKSALLELYMRQNAKDRLIKEQDRLKKERERLQKKRKQINQNLNEINKRMAALFKLATTKTGKNLKKIADESKNHTVLEY